MKTRILILAATLLILGTRSGFAATDLGDELSKAELKRIDDTKKQFDDARKDPGKHTRDLVDKAMREWVGDGHSFCSCGGAWRDMDGVTHVLEFVDGHKIERVFYMNGSSVSTGSEQINGVTKDVTRIRTYEGKLLEVITWNRTNATITDASGKVLETIEWKKEVRR